MRLGRDGGGTSYAEAREQDRVIQGAESVQDQLVQRVADSAAALRRTLGNPTSIDNNNDNNNNNNNNNHNNNNNNN